jgi:hypothetical protein
MAKTKAEPKDTRTQRQKFIDKARELETDESPEAFNRVVTTLAKAPVAKTKKSEKSKG